MTEINHLWWGETNYHPEVPRTPVATETTLILDAVYKTKSCIPQWISLKDLSQNEKLSEIKLPLNMIQ